MQPRIYTYKITFDEAPYYYYGVHKEKAFNEKYWGSPITHKWIWDFYTPKKQILELFEYSDEGWLNANLVEDRLIKPFYQNDKWCLNESCGGSISLKVRKKTANKNRELKLGIYSLSKEDFVKNGIINGINAKKNGTGIFSLTDTQKTERSKKIGLNHKKNNTGVCGMSLDQRIENGKKSGNQRWKCLETGYISNAGGLVSYQKKRGIDTSRRIQIS